MWRLLLVFLVLLPWPARGELVLPGRVDRLVAAGSLVAVVRGDELRVLTDDGRPLWRLGRPSDADDGAPAGAGARRAEELLDRYGIPEEERDGADAERLLEDETTLRERRAARPAGAEIAEAPATRLLAAADSTLWIADGRTLWRIEESAPARPVASLPLRFDHLAAAGDRLIAAAGGRVWLSEDAGVSFAPLAEADGPVRAVTAAGRALAWATAATVSWHADDGERTFPMAAPVRDLRLCGTGLLALHGAGLSLIEGAGPREVLLDGRRLACGAGATVAIAGPRLLISTDGGALFEERRDQPPLPVIDVALGARCLWIATAAGLHCLPPREPAGAIRPAMAFTPARLLAPSPWASLLPQVAVAATAVTGPGRRDLGAVAFAEFGLGSPAPPPRLLLAQAPAIELPAPPPVRLGPDRDASCLPVARVAAVERALAEPERARSFVRRAANAAWLPELRFRVDRRLGRSESLDVPSGGTGAGPLGLDTANDVRYEARATWDLSKLVFSTEELAAETQALRMGDVRREIESLANRLYFERRRLKMELPLSPAPDAARARRELRVQELEAELDVLSGGAFTRCLPAPP